VFTVDSTAVVSILIVNIDNLPVSQYASAFVAAGVDKLSYSPSSASLLASGWPTLDSMITAGTRLVTFMDNGANFASVPYIIDGLYYLIFTDHTSTNEIPQSLPMFGNRPSILQIQRCSIAR
jgi:hypothetical protein